MALIKCIECEKEFSDKASACPNCGCPTSAMVTSTYQTQQTETTISYQLKTISDFTAYAEEEYKKIQEYRVLRDELQKSVENLRNESEEIKEKIKHYATIAQTAFENLQIAEEEYKQACKGLLKENSKKAKEAKVREEDARKLYEKAEYDPEYISLQKRKKELDDYLYSPYSEYIRNHKKLGSNYPLHKYAWVKETAHTGRDATQEEFKKAIYSNYVKSELKRYVEEIGTIDIKYFEEITGFTQVLSEAFSLTRDEDYHLEDYHDTQLFCKGKKASPQKPETPVILDDFSPYDAMVDAYTPKKKDASVIGRAVAGGLLAGPTGAIVGALSAVDKNNKNK